MRLSESNSYRGLLRDLSQIEERMQIAQSQVSSGKRLAKPSDDPSTATDVLRLQGEKGEVEQYLQGIDSGRGRLEFADAVLDNVEQMVERIRNLGILSLNDALNGSLYSTEISGLRDQLVASANSTFQGKSIFAGSATGAPAYIVNPDTSVSYQGNSDEVRLQINRSTTMAVQIPGSDVFSGSVDIFQTVADLVTAINSGNKSAMDTQLGKLQQFHDGLSINRAKVGGLVNLAGMAEAELRSYQLVRERELVQMESADLAKALTEFTQSENALKAATAIGARVTGTSILDYL